MSRFSPRLAVWLVMIIILIMSLLQAVEKLRPEAEDVAYAVAAKRILDRANFYKEHWLVGGTPQSMRVADQLIWFDNKGWPQPLRSEDGRADCRRWLELLHPEEGIFSDNPRYKNESTSIGYQCRYSYYEKKAVVIRLQDGQFSVSVEYN